MTLGLFWTSKKILFRAEQLLKLENYESVDRRLHFSAIETESKISFQMIGTLNEINCSHIRLILMALYY